jgi:alpha-1,3-rhamnosyl/mannosyltransferase
MRIGVDISVCAFNSAGSARHSTWLLHALQREAPAQGAMVVPLRLPERLQLAAGARRKALVLFWEFVYAPRLLGLIGRARRCDLIHATALMPLAKMELPTVATLHDLLPALYPGYFTRVMGVRMRRWLKLMVRNADHVITSSAHTAGDLRRVEPNLRAQVSVVYPGSFLERAAVAPARPTRPAAPYILAVGTLEPRKNLPTALRAYRMLADNSTAPPELLLVGSDGWLTAELDAELRRPWAAGRVRTTGYVPDAELAALYAGACMLVYPSLYEGFGFPPLEAMSCGCPVVASRASSLPEVVGDAGLLVDPHSPRQLAAAMGLVLEQPQLAAHLRRRGYAQAQRFSWRRCAQETLEIYRQVLERREPAQ